MIDFSFLEKLEQLKDIIISSSFSFISLIIGIVLLIVMIIGIKNNRRIPKLIFIITWIFVAIFVIVRYNSQLVYIFDRLFGRIVEKIYFPSVTIYIVMLLLANIIFVISYNMKKLNNIIKVVNISVAMELDFLFVLVLDTIVNNNVDIYSDITIYANAQILVLLEFSMFLFLLWMLLLVILILINKFAVKTVFVNLFKESDYEIITMDDELEDDIEILDI